MRRNGDIIFLRNLAASGDIRFVFVTERLAREPVATVRRMEYRARTAKPGLLGFLPEATLRHLAYSRTAWPLRVATLPRAYQYAWEVDRLRKVPYYAAMKGVRRMGKALRGRI